MNSSQRRYQYQAAALLQRFPEIATVKDVTQTIIDRWRANAWGLSPVYIENCVKAVTILTGRKFSGDKLPQKMKRPHLVSLDDLGKVYQAAVDDGHDWLAAFLRFAFITGLRLEDLTNLPRAAFKPDCVQVEARKTGKLHIIPRHPILGFELPSGERPLYRNCQTVRFTIARYCESAGVPYFPPKSIRKTAITEYEVARPGAGAVLQGSAISGANAVTWRHYIDHETILRQAQLHLRVPTPMVPRDLRDEAERRERQLMDRFRRMGQAEKDAVLRVVSAMG